MISAAVCVLALMTVPVLAQFGNFNNQQRGNFDSFFSPFQAPRSAPERPVDYSRAPSPRKYDTQPAGGSVLVLGDSMADWLASGLEDAFGDQPDLAVVRKNRATSGLIRYDSRNETPDWPQVIRETIAQNKPNYIVMMVGLNDRTSLRERVSPAPATTPGAKPGTPAPAQAPAAAKPPAAQQPPQQQAAPAGEKAAAEAKPDPNDAEQGPPETPAASATPEPPPQKDKNGTVITTYRIYDFHTDEWEIGYTKRIDATIAALKSANVPVFWVGLPSIRGPKATAEMQYLNDLFRARVEKANLNYIDVWDGFVDDSGRFTPQGPDFEGQIRRLRAGDGVHFTKAGARKLAHYLERELRRVMAPGGEVVALPSSEPVPAQPAKPSGPAARPLAGPVVPLTTSASSGQELLGGKSADPNPAPPKSVTRVLVNGESIDAPAGRADDFAWPRRVIAPVGTDPIVATTNEPIPVMKPAPETTVAAPNGDVRPVAAAAAPRRTAARPVTVPQPQRSNGIFSFFR